MQKPAAILFALVLMATGCGETTTNPGAGGSGSGGAGGMGGSGAAGGAAPKCIEWMEGDSQCSNGDIDPIEPCCELPAPPEQPDACDGSESVVNPSSCTGGGVTRTYLLTALEIHPDCNAGFDLDGCNGATCQSRGLTSGEGVGGVDNTIAGMGWVIAGVGGNLGPVNQAFADALCGRTDGEVEACGQDIPLLELRFAVDANESQACANVTMFSGMTEVGTVAMNLSDDGCLSGRLPSIRLVFGGTEGQLANVTLQTTISAAGFSNGVMGATADIAFASDIALASFPPSAQSIVFLDINEDLSVDDESFCNAMSGTYRIGGVVE